MPRTKLPPTPASSTGPTPKDKAMYEMETSFALPPAALKNSPPASPVVTRKRTLSGSAKAKDDLPPPPSRARKIIQMKPREEPPTPTTPTSSSVPTKTTTPNGKKKQPSATSAAGRKIARKTAHSIIERRRRSKMNEEFGVLKDMIPACKGVEMHKLAILQAGIEYVRYLQGCVESLQDRDEPPPFRMQRHLADEHEDDEEMDDTEERNVDCATPNASSNRFDHDLRRASTATTATTASTNASPRIRPNISSSSLASQRQLPPLPLAKKYSTSPPPLALSQPPLQTGISPAFNAINFSYETGRNYNQARSMSTGKPSPHMLPLPHTGPFSPPTLPASYTNDTAHSPVQQSGDAQAEVTATAALMMMGNDRRANSSGRGKGMSVHDLLTH